MNLFESLLSRAIKRGPLTIVFEDGRSVRFGEPDPALRPVTARLGPGVANAILRDPALGAAEAYMDGRLRIEDGDILDLLMLTSANDAYEHGNRLLTPGPLHRLGRVIAHRIGRINMRRQAKRNVAHHYDLSDRLYDLFLDADRQYSCAYFTDPANSLEQAQWDKKAHIAAKLALEPGMRVLDIGCGWGGMALFLHEQAGVDVLGVTLSEEQLKVARARAEAAGVADHVRFELIDYRDVTGAFDRIVSVGMFEHVGTPNYRTFFTKCRELLTPDGVMLVHTIGRAGEPGTTDSFTAKYIFPGGYLPALSEIARGYEGLHYYLTDVEVLRTHYAFTLRRWYDRTNAARDAIVAMYDERFFRMWQFYLAGAIVGFLNGGLVNYQLQFARSRTALPITRDYMAEAEERLRVPAGEDRAALRKVG